MQKTVFNYTPHTQHLPSSLPHLNMLNINHHPSPFSIFSTFTVIPPLPPPLHLLNIYHHPPFTCSTFTIMPSPPLPHTQHLQSSLTHLHILNIYYHPSHISTYLNSPSSLPHIYILNSCPGKN